MALRGACVLGAILALSCSVVGDDAGAGGASGAGGDPLFDPGGDSCAAAAASRSYLGCDFWPTVTANPVWSVFDFAVVVANGGSEPVSVAVARAGATVASVEIAPNALETIYLPWVHELKAPREADACYRRPNFDGSVFVDDGAYHLVSSAPVTVYQFNALQYRGAGGPPGKDWSSCPGEAICELSGMPFGCFSFSNDASLLLPSTAMTGTYRVTSTTAGEDGGFLALTATRDGTELQLSLSSSAAIAPGGGIDAIGPGGGAKLRMNAGDVIELIGTPGSDFSGTLVEANHPLQVIAGMPCLNVPIDAPACDHLEETVMPAETLGTRYLVTRPSGPNGDQPGHVVRLYGNFDDTALSYPAGQPDGAPSTLNAGEVVDLGIVSIDFEVQGDQPFAIASFNLGGSIVDPDTPTGEQRGDPDQSLVTSVEQFRARYVFLAPEDYDVSYVDIVQPVDARVTLDGAAVTAPVTPIGASGYGLARVTLGTTPTGAHLLEANQPVGIQVVGYGAYTSYYYPGGLDLRAIAPPPVK